MSDYLTATQSLCRHCRRLIPAHVFLEADGVWFHKHCPEHGAQTARVHGDPEVYRSLGRYHRRAAQPRAFATEARGCPDSCGLCPEHEQHVCLPILEITDHCNLDCPICLVTNPGQRHLTRGEVAPMLDALIRAEGSVDVLNLSGGEPTLNPHFRDIVEECLARTELQRVSVSTNGLRLAADRELLQFLAERRVIVSLQYDGASDAAYRSLRGRPMLAEKRRMLDQCAELQVPTSLTMTVVRGVNDDQLHDVAELLFARDHILSAMFQPAAYVGRAAGLGRPAEAMTISDVIVGLDGAAKGTVVPTDFSPLPCSHPACFALAYYLKADGGRFLPIRQIVSEPCYLELIRNRAIFGTDAESFRQVTEAVYELWSGSAGGAPVPARNENAPACPPGGTCGCNPWLSDQALRSIKGLWQAATADGGYTPRKAWAVGERAVKSIFIHQFMDPDTFDLSRARKCCQVYPQPDGRLIPACVHNCLRRGLA